MASAYCAALKRILTGVTRLAVSAITRLATYTAVAGATPNRNRIAKAKVVEIVTLARPRRWGTGIGISSPTTAKAASAQKSPGASIRQWWVRRRATSTTTATTAVAAA